MKTILSIIVVFMLLAMAYGIGIKSIDLVLDAGLFLLASTLTLTFLSFARI